MSALTPEQLASPDLKLMTFGLELEGRFKFRDPALNGPWQPDLITLGKQLQEATGLEFNVGFTEAQEAKHGTWSLCVDTSIRQVVDQCTFELRSRVLSQGNLEADLAEVRLVLDAFRKIAHISIDESCGFHVHVGFGNRGFPLRTLQNAVAITAGFEHLLLTLHPIYRQINQYCPNFGKSDGVQKGYFSGQSSGLGSLAPGYERVAAIMKTTQWDELRGKLISSESDRMAYHFVSCVTNWDTPLKRSFRTVEFRQSEMPMGQDGGFGLERIEAWVSFCRSLIAYSLLATDDQLVQLFANLRRDEKEFTVCDLFKAMGFRDLSDFYSLRLYARSAELLFPRESEEGSALVAAAIADRTKVMQQVEACRRARRHLPVERAVIANAHWKAGHADWVPYQDFPYTMSHRDMISAAQMSYDRRRMDQQEQIATDSQDATASPWDKRPLEFGFFGVARTT